MIKIPISEIVRKISVNTQLGEEEIRDRIKKKMDELSGLISEEGAGHIVANELGVKLFQATSGVLPIKEIRPGMRNIETIGRITNIFEIREFDTGSRKGKVGNFMIEDETGGIRVTLWNDMADKILKLEQGNIVKIKSAYVRENNMGYRELHLSDKSSLIINPPGVEVGERVSSKKRINELTDEDTNIEILGHITEVYPPVFFEICPDCGKRIRLEGDSYNCAAHGKVEPKYAYVVNILLDDGTGSMRTTFWRNQAEKLFGNLDPIKENPEIFNSITADFIGTMIKVTGRTRRNTVTQDIEFSVNSVDKDVDASAEVKEFEKQATKAKEESTPTEEEVIE